MRRGLWFVLGGALVTVVAVVFAIVVLFDGDGASDHPSSVPPGGALGAAPVEFQDCLAEQGVEFDGGPPGGQPDAETTAAIEACQELLPEPPQGANLPPPPEGDTFTPPSSG